LKRIAALTSVRNGERFLKRWITYYGHELGYQNLFIILDGVDQEGPDSDLGLNLHWFDHVPMSRVAGDKFRANRASVLAHELMQTYDLVIGTDVDEFLVLDPHRSEGLLQYISQRPITSNLSGMGIDVAQHRIKEHNLDWSKPFLDQRQYGVISDRYTKASILSEPHFWGSGYHRVKGQPFEIDPYLYLLHFGSVDDLETNARSADQERVKSGWSGHQLRRNAISDLVSTCEPNDGDKAFDNARHLLSRRRSLISWNKPRQLKPHQVIKIPARFKGLV
tara:strand:- start:117 stop:950 length:834 start_codon:yes stop_codon:yes gene_type:complete